MNYKGGVGKTTFAACTAQALALTGFRVLAVDNDGQHDLSDMLRIDRRSPTIRDVYHAGIGPASQKLMKAIRETDVACLQAVPSQNELCNADVTDPYHLKKCFTYAMLQRFYDYVLIDNAPGLDALQMASVHAADEIFVPTELKQFALSGLRDMDEALRTRYPDACPITHVIPLFYRDTKSQNQNLALLREQFGERVVETPIPYDNIFDEIVAEGKNLFVSHLATRGAAYYLKVTHELFGLDEDRTWQMVAQKRRQRQVEAAQRLHHGRQSTSDTAQFAPAQALAGVQPPPQQHP
jgi:chromosome partitioning protein